SPRSRASAPHSPRPSSARWRLDRRNPPSTRPQVKSSSDPSGRHQGAQVTATSGAGIPPAPDSGPIQLGMQGNHHGPSELLIITGMSGAGRSTAAKVLEDLGWYVVDNLPPQLIESLLELTETPGRDVPRLAVAVDVRGRSF